LCRRLSTRVLIIFRTTAPNSPESCRALKHDFYVDDFLGDAGSISEGLKLRDDLITVLQRAGMELCKWSSNNPSLLENVDTATNVNANDNLIDFENTTKILGMYWNQNIDAYCMSVQRKYAYYEAGNLIRNSVNV